MHPCSLSVKSFTWKATRPLWALYRSVSPAKVHSVIFHLFCNCRALQTCVCYLSVGQFSASSLHFNLSRHLVPYCRTLLVYPRPKPFSPALCESLRRLPFKSGCGAIVFVLHCICLRAKHTIGGLAVQFHFGFYCTGNHAISLSQIPQRFASSFVLRCATAVRY